MKPKNRITGKFSAQPVEYSDPAVADFMAGYENTWVAIQAWIFAAGINEAKIRARAEYNRMVNAITSAKSNLNLEDKVHPYERGVLSCFAGYIQRHRMVGAFPHSFLDTVNF